MGKYKKMKKNAPQNKIAWNLTSLRIESAYTQFHCLASGETQVPGRFLSARSKPFKSSPTAPDTVLRSEPVRWNL